MIMYAPGDSGNLFGFTLATRIGDLINEANSMPCAECRMPNEIWHMACKIKLGDTMVWLKATISVALSHTSKLFIAQ